MLAVVAHQATKRILVMMRLIITNSHHVTKITKRGIHLTIHLLHLAIHFLHSVFSLPTTNGTAILIKMTRYVTIHVTIRSTKAMLILTILHGSVKEMVKRILI